MSVYRSLDDDLHLGHNKDGLNRCNRALKKNPKDALLNVYRARFMRALGQRTEADAVIKSLADPGFRIQDTAVLEEIDTFLWEGSQDAAYPPSLSNGPESSKLWTNIASTTPRQYHVPLYKDRYTHAVSQQRWVDAGYALSSWRKIEPNRKDLRFAHVTVYQLIAETAKDDPTVRMNSLLADRTLQQLISDDATATEVKLMIKVFSRQKCYSRLSGFVEKFKPLLLKDHLSAVALIDVLKEAEDWQQLLVLTTSLLTLADSDTTDSDPEESNAVSDWRVWEAWFMANDHLSSVKEMNHVLMNQLDSDGRTGHLAFMRFAYKCRDWEDLLTEAKTFFEHFKEMNFCYSALREFLLAMPTDHQRQFRIFAAGLTKAWPGETDEVADKIAGLWVAAECSLLRIEYLLTIGQAVEPPTDHIYSFIHNAMRLHTFRSHNTITMNGFPELLVSALLRADEADSVEEHLLLALVLTFDTFADTITPSQNILLSQLSAHFGLYGHALRAFKQLNLKEIQMETATHIGLTRVSISYPTGLVGNDKGYAGPKSARDFLKASLDMFEPTIARIADQECSLLDCSRFDLLLELEDLRKSLEHSLNRRMMILELRRLDRLTNHAQDTKYTIHPAVVEMWTDDLQDGRDFTACDRFDAGTNTTSLVRRLQDGGAVPDADWIRYHLWIDEVCSLALGGPLLARPFLDAAAATEPIERSTAFTKEEKAMVPFWRALATASALALAPEQAKLLPDAPKDLVAALDSLQNALMGLKIDTITPPSNPTRMLPYSSTIQAILLQMDFLKAIERFVGACSKTTNVKTTKQTLVKLSQTAKAHFEELRKFALLRRAQLDPTALGQKIEGSKERVIKAANAYDHKASNPTNPRIDEWKDPDSLTKGKTDTEWAASFVHDAEETWDNVLRVKFAAA
ncbi:hypothetical protein K461DRAFT_33868 [Myriangium duriaei CBS 260.36]|uniref:Uncharacterized protein n=1 Tax=Myriangium duriaei CBS 260.36 TaxID=1168546 RepID=A0A9P4ITM1_9PEZI|nr:hypothetical protein K461DRAFT_33868 [Myriangium duriaei CBS 260.36]